MRELHPPFPQPPKQLQPFGIGVQEIAQLQLERRGHFGDGVVTDAHVLTLEVARDADDRGAIPFEYIQPYRHGPPT